MQTETLKALQAPLKELYRRDPVAALVTLHRAGRVEEDRIACRLGNGSGRRAVVAGLHPAAGGDGSLASSAEMLLDALVACAGVTVRAVAEALEFDLREAIVSAEGELDVRGAMAIATDAAVGFRGIRLHFELDTDEPAERIERLLHLTERYCVVLQTLRASTGVAVTTRWLPPDRALWRQV